MLTNAELLVLKNDLITTRKDTVYSGGSLSAHLGNTKLQLLADYYNSNASPAVMIWKPDLLNTDFINALVGTDINGTTATFTVRREGLMVLLKAGYFNMTSATMRATILAVLGATTSNTNVLAIGQRAATNFEALFTTSNISSRYGYLVTGADIIDSYRAN